MPSGKKLTLSRTFWIAVAQAISGLIAIFASDNPTLKITGVSLVVKSVMDIIIRLDTSDPIKNL